MLDKQVEISILTRGVRTLVQTLQFEYDLYWCRAIARTEKADLAIFHEFAPLPTSGGASFRGYDEVFATGDAHFVEKSTQRILQLLERSNIVVIVTHSFEQIEKLCNRAIVIEKGVVVNDGKPKKL